ncbi:MAG: TPM domain-containing protein [Proteobacteria bacterium]|nr:TPM domain-containing protein [Pseudomonadota bacterium]
MSLIQRHWQVMLVPLCLLFSFNLLHAKPTFPELTGRVIDNAHMLDDAIEQRIAARLSQHENATTNQVVVITLNNLGGYVNLPILVPS